MSLPEFGWKGYGRPGFDCRALQLSACADYRHADLALTREHKGLAVMHGIPREIAYRVSFALACIAWESQT